MKNSADQGGCYPPRPKAEVDNTLRDLQNSSYPTKAEFNNCFIIHSKYFPVLNGVSPFRSLFFCSPKSQSRPQVFSVNGWIICSGLHFWLHRNACYAGYTRHFVFIWITHYSLGRGWIMLISIYTLSDLGVLSNLIGSLSLANEHYYSTNCNTIQIWSWCSRYPSSVGDGYPAIYVASYVGRKSEVKKCWQKGLKMLRAWKSSLLSICWIIKQLSCSILRNIVWF